MEGIYSDTTLTSPHMQRKETQNQTKETNKTQNEKKKKKEHHISVVLPNTPVQHAKLCTKGR